MPGNFCSTRIFGTRTRFFILPVVLLCLSCIWANILSFNLATVCINNEYAKNNTEITISQSETTYSIAAIAAGALIANIPVVYFVNKFGSRTVFTILGFLTSTATALLPPAINAGFGWLIVCRLLQGVSFAANFPVIGAFTARWTYHKQSGLFVSVLVCYIQIAPIFSNSVGGVLCDSLGWSSIFYVHGGLSLALFVVYFLVFRNSPEKHPFVSLEEADKIARGKPKIRVMAVPYRSILKTPCIWAIWIAALGNAVISNIFFVFTPIYMAKALHFSTSKSGFNAMYPPLAQLITKILIGLISDNIKFLSNQWKFRIFNTISFFGAAAVTVALALMEDSHPSANSPVMAVTLAILGVNTGGFYKAAPFLSKQHSSFVTGMISQCNCLILLIIPFVVQAITPNETVEEWKIVFFLIAGTLIITNIIFVIFIKGTPFWWTDELSLESSKISTITGSISCKSFSTIEKVEIEKF